MGPADFTLPFVKRNVSTTSSTLHISSACRRCILSTDSEANYVHGLKRLESIYVVALPDFADCFGWGKCACCEALVLHTIHVQAV